MVIPGTSVGTPESKKDAEAACRLEGGPTPASSVGSGMNCEIDRHERPRIVSPLLQMDGAGTMHYHLQGLEARTSRRLTGQQ